MTQLTIYFDGACPLCSREIDHYRKRDRAGALRLVDIAAPGFDALADGLDPVRVQRELHVRLPSGDVVTRMPAFIAIWRVLPGYGWLANLAELPGIRQLLSVAYLAFARVRPYLPRRRDAACHDGACLVRTSTVGVGG